MSIKTRKEKSTPVLNAIRHLCPNLLFLCTPTFTKELRFHVTSVVIQRALGHHYNGIKRTTMKNKKSLIATLVITKAKEKISVSILNQNMDQNVSTVKLASIPQQQGKLSVSILNQNMDQNGSTVKLVSTPHQAPHMSGTTLKECMELLFSIVMNANISAIRLVH